MVFHLYLQQCSILAAHILWHQCRNKGVQIETFMRKAKNYSETDADLFFQCSFCV